MTTAVARGRTTTSTAPICCCADVALAGTSAAELRKAVYAEFMYGYGQVPGVNLGAPLAYTSSGPLHRQEFEGGVTLANTSDSPVDLYLGRGYLDLGNVLRRYVVLPPHSAEILLSCGRR